MSSFWVLWMIARGHLASRIIQLRANSPWCFSLAATAAFSASSIVWYTPENTIVPMCFTIATQFLLAFFVKDTLNPRLANSLNLCVACLLAMRGHP